MLVKELIEALSGNGYIVIKSRDGSNYKDLCSINKWDINGDFVYGDRIVELFDINTEKYGLTIVVGDRQIPDDWSYDDIFEEFIQLYPEFKGHIQQWVPYSDYMTIYIDLKAENLWLIYDYRTQRARQLSKEEHDKYMKERAK